MTERNLTTERKLMAIDPGNTESGWVVVSTADCRPLQFGKTDNDELARMIASGEQRFTLAVVEMVASYGMPVGAEVFETCVWIGRFVERLIARIHHEPERIKRLDIKTHHCHSSRANDATVKQALVDRFASGARNYGKGTKADPGWFYGFKADIWAAYALAVYAIDTGRGVSGDLS